MFKYLIFLAVTTVLEEKIDTGFESMESQSAKLMLAMRGIAWFLLLVGSG